MFTGHLTIDYRKAVALLLCAATTGAIGCAQAVLMPATWAGDEYRSAYAEGIQAADTRDDELLYGAAACAVGLPLSVAVAHYGATAEANPPSVLLVGKSDEYIRGFSAGYDARMRQKRGSAAWVGTGVNLAVGVLVTYFFIFSFGHVH